MRINKLWLGGALGLAAVLSLVAVGSTAATTSYEFLARGTVKTGGTDLNVYFTHTSPLAEADLAGQRSDISISTAKIYQWTLNSKGNLYKKPVKAGSLVPGQEVVIKGVKKSNGVFVANWVVINYRGFTINGKLTGVEKDVGYSDQGWVTIEVGNSTYKQSQLVDKDVKMRVDGNTAISSLGKSKNFDEVTVKNQSVRVKGTVVNGQYALSSLTEL